MEAAASSANAGGAEQRRTEPMKLCVFTALSPTRGENNQREVGFNVSFSLPGLLSVGTSGCD